MPAAPRISPTRLFTPDEWAPFQARSHWRGPLLVLHAWAVIALAVAAGVIWPVLIPISIMIIGARQLGLAILMHEAAHGALAKNLKLNDVLGHWLCAVPIGASLTAYRPYHLYHHKFAQQPEDPDLVLSEPFPVTGASLRRKIIRDLTGQTFFKQRVMLLVGAFRNQRDEDMAEGAVVTGKSVAPFLMVNAGMLAALTLAVVTASQTIGMALWLRLTEPGALRRVMASWRKTALVGITGMLGSLGWFTAFTLQNAAYVRALGQVELVFSVLVAWLVFRERSSGRELAGIALIALSIAAIVLLA